MEPKLLIFWETGVCGDLIGGMWDWTLTLDIFSDHRSPSNPVPAKEFKIHCQLSPAK